MWYGAADFTLKVTPNRLFSFPLETLTVFDRISHSWSLAMSTCGVLAKNKKLVLFPLLSGIACILVILSFLVPTVLLFDKLDMVDANGNVQLPWWTYLVAFAFYFCLYFVMIFCNSALISCALVSFSGEKTTLGDGFGAAFSRLPQIFAWALVAATVGMLLKLLENAHEKIGYFISAILGTAWSITTYFVVPVLVVEKLGPIEAFRRSLAILRKTWGEALAGHIGLGFFQMLLILPGVALLVGSGVALGLTHSIVLAGVMLGAGFLWILSSSLICSALSTIYLAALYQFAAFDRVPVGYERETLSGAFMQKR
jgi:Family of unknown function (DUF6159)